MKAKITVMLVAALIACTIANAQSKFPVNSATNTITPFNKTYVPSDVYINGVRVGRGSGNVKTNTVTGASALGNNAGEAGYNTATGDSTLYANTSGSYNTASGANALHSNLSGIYNTAGGYRSLYSNTTGTDNCAFGFDALYGNTSGYLNVAIGKEALYNDSAGFGLVAVGAFALHNQTFSQNAFYANTGIGYGALYANTFGAFNTAVGSQALLNNTIGSSNVAIGQFALRNTTTGYYNVGIGVTTFASNVTGSSNTGVGNYADVDSGSLDNAMALGFTAHVNASNKVQVGNTNVTVIGGQVGWSNFSDGRFKKDIQQNVPGLVFINKLKPVTYHVQLEKFEKFAGVRDSILDMMKPDLQNAEQKLRTGFVAQEVEKAAQDINYDFDGVNKPQNGKDNYSLVYADFVPSLVKAVQELSVQNDSLKKINNDLEQRMEKIEAMLNVSNQLSASGKLSALSSSSLSQNTPNPFTHSTNINYYLAVNDGNACINFYGENGTLLKTVKLSGSGKGSISITSNELAGGIYRYALLIDGKVTDARQMISSN